MSASIAPFGAPTGSERPSMSETRNKLLAIIAEIAEIEDPTTIRNNSRLYEDLELDSMMALEVVLMVEEAFDIAIDEDVLNTLVTFEDIVQRIEAQATTKQKTERDSRKPPP